MTIGSTLKRTGLVCVGAAMMVAGTAIAPAEAVPIARMTSASATSSGLEPVAYLHRYYGHRRYHRFVRRDHHRHLAPNYFCRGQPSRCR